MSLILMSTKLGSSTGSLNLQSFLVDLIPALIPAIISFFASIWINIKTNKAQIQIEKDNESFKKSIAKANNIFQEDMTNRKISADIKAKSRIEWIQSVRKETAEYINSYYGYLNTYVDHRIKSTELKKRELEVNRHSTLLSLYFADKVEFTDDDLKQIHLDLLGLTLFNLFKTTKGKTNSIEWVNDKTTKKRLDNLFQTMADEIQKVKPIKYNKATDASDYSPIYNLSYKTSNNIGKNRIIQAYINILSPNSNYGKFFNSKYGRISKNINLEYKKTLLSELQKIISLYLKIEWDRAKNDE